MGCFYWIDCGGEFVDFVFVFDCLGFFLNVGWGECWWSWYWVIVFWLDGMFYSWCVFRWSVWWCYYVDL